MADLTIKPQAGSSNKLILQDQQAGAVLTTATSGATLNNASLTNVSGTFGSSILLGNEQARISAANPSAITVTGKLSPSSDSVCTEAGVWSGVETRLHNAQVTSLYLQLDYGSGNTKHISEISWHQYDGGGSGGTLSTGIFWEGSADGTSWTRLSTITAAITNGTDYKYTSTSDAAYRYFRLYYTWASSGNYCSISNLRVVERDGGTSLSRAQIGQGSTGSLGSQVIFPSGHTLQTVHEIAEDQSIALSSSEAVACEVDLVTIGVNSKFMIWAGISHGGSNTDADACSAIGYKTGAYSASSGNYSAIHGNYTREEIGNMGSWYAVDTIGGATAGTWGGAYFIRQMSSCHEKALNYGAGQALNFALWIRSGNAQTRFGTSANSAAGDAGCSMYITVAEIAI